MDMIEKVADAMRDHARKRGLVMNWGEYARVAIAAMQEPNATMILAGVSALSGNGVDEANLDDATLCYQAMINASLLSGVRAQALADLAEGDAELIGDPKAG